MEQSSPADANLSTTGACLTCRDKHLKCDGNLAGCSRCSNLGLYCHFVPSRRGRRSQPAPLADYTPSPAVDSLAHPQSTLPDLAFPIIPADLFDPLSASSREGSQLVAIYYLHFHLAHPFLPPHNVFIQSSPPKYLLDLVEFISLHYLASQHVLDCLGNLQTAIQDAQLSVEKAQAYLLLSIILHAREQPEGAKESIARAIHCSLELGLHCREFSEALEMQSPVRAESARRTWWEIFVIDTLLAAVQVEGILQYTLEMPDVLLPCEEDKYHDGHLPGPAVTVNELGLYSMFSDNGNISSFAYRVEAAIILRRCLLISKTHVSQDSLDMLDATISAWFHRFPSGKRVILQANGEVNELDLQATTIMHCALIYLHFPKSFLLSFLPTTGHLFCSRPPSFSSPSANPQMHTAKVVAAAVNLSKLASLSTSVVNHSPFFACTLVLSSIIELAILSFHSQQPVGNYCSFLALNIGFLKSMGGIWTIAATSTARLRDVAIEIEAASSGRSKGLTLENQWFLSD